jgi:hypothetical protein
MSILLTRTLLHRSATIALLLLSGCDSCTINEENATSESGDNVNNVNETGEDLSEAVPFPRWILRDKDGVPVKALVRPTCGFSNYGGCEHPDFEDFNFTCIHVSFLGSRYINTKYSLATGRIEGEGCGLNFPGLDGYDYIPSVVFVDPDCSGTPYASPGVMFEANPGDDSVDLPPRRISVIGDKLLYASMNAGASDSPVYYEPVYSQNKCLSWTMVEPLYPLLPVPVEVLDALPNPPYHLTIEY